MIGCMHALVETGISVRQRWARWISYALCIGNPPDLVTCRLTHAIEQGDRVVSEWSCLWTPPSTSSRLMAPGTEWYTLRDRLISEVRALRRVS
jgi:hypothetical protein